jgi:hypothetical protein
MRPEKKQLLEFMVVAIPALPTLWWPKANSKPPAAVQKSPFMEGA